MFSLEVLLQTPNSASVSGEHGKSLALMTILDSVTVIMSSFGQIEQGAHYIRKSLIYSTRKTFLERAVVELVYNFDEKSTTSV